MNSAAIPAVSEAVRLPFRDRKEAGRILAGRLQPYAHLPDALVAAVPRGGLPVGAEIATLLRLPLAVFLVRKLGVPGQEELAMGSVSSGGVKFINREIVESLRIPESVIQSVVFRETQELLRREGLYSRGRPPAQFRDKTVILTDDGAATGASLLVAVQALRQQGAGKVVVAVPVGSRQAIDALAAAADEVVCLAEPVQFLAVGNWYEDFHQVSDFEVCQLLDGLLERSPISQSA